MQPPSFGLRLVDINIKLHTAISLFHSADCSDGNRILPAQFSADGASAFQQIIPAHVTHSRSCSREFLPSPLVRHLRPLRESLRARSSGVGQSWLWQRCVCCISIEILDGIPLEYLFRLYGFFFYDFFTGYPYLYVLQNYNNSQVNYF